MTLLRVERLDVRHGLLRAVRDVDFSVEPGEILALIGANGAGKTTLLRALAGAHLPHAGRILLAGQDVTRMQAHRRVAEGIALVPEGRRLFADMTVAENLRLACTTDRAGSWDLHAVLKVFPNLAARLNARAGTLSGGEQQAVAIGRALLTNPVLLLLDEISLGLSPAAVDRVYAALATLTESGTTMILVEQDLSRALHVSTRAICMLEGRIALQGALATLDRAAITGAYFGLPAVPVETR